MSNGYKIPDLNSVPVTNMAIKRVTEYRWGYRAIRADKAINTRFVNTLTQGRGRDVQQWTVTFNSKTKLLNI